MLCGAEQCSSATEMAYAAHESARTRRTVALPMTNLPDYVIFEYDCHEGNYGLAHALKGARAEEKAAETAKKD